MAEKENILTHTYDLLLYLIPQLGKFPRDQRFELGHRLQNLTHDILDDFVTAYYLGTTGPKIEKLKTANLNPYEGCQPS